MFKIRNSQYSANNRLITGYQYILEKIKQNELYSINLNVRQSQIYPKEIILLTSTVEFNTVEFLEHHRDSNLSGKSMTIKV